MALQFVANPIVGSIFASAGRAILGFGDKRAGGIFSDAGILIGQAIAGTPGINPTAPAPTTPPATGGELFEELLKRPNNSTGQTPRSSEPFEELLRRTPSTPQPPPSEFEQLLRRVPYSAAPGSLAWVLARAAGLLGGLLYPTPTARDDTISEEELRRRVRDRNRRRPRGRPEGDRPPTEPPPGIPEDAWRGPSPDTGPKQPLPAPLPYPFGVLPPRLPSSGTNPRPQPAKRPKARPAPSPRPHPIGSTSPFRLPFQLPLPAPGPTPDRLSLTQPGESIGVPYRTADTDRLASPLTSPQPSPLTSPAPPDNCTCTRSSGNRKKRKRKERKECRRGTYIETKSGLKKSPKEKIQCQ